VPQRPSAACATQLSADPLGGQNPEANMFERIKRQWREARGEGLRREFEDAVLRLNGLGPEVNARASLTLAKSLRELEAKYGPLTNISNDGKLRLAKQIRQAAKQKFTFDMGTGYGLALLSMHIESQAVPGDHGRFVQSSSQGFVDAALQVEQSTDRASSDELGGTTAPTPTPNPDGAAAGAAATEFPTSDGRLTRREWLERRRDSDVADLSMLRDSLYGEGGRAIDQPELRAAVVRLLSSPVETARSMVTKLVEIDESVMREAAEYHAYEESIID